VADVEMKADDDAGRLAARFSVVLGVVWIFGFASLAAIPLALLALSTTGLGRGDRIAAWVGLTLGVLGIGVAVWFGVTGY
jgi:hypothetical protein